MPSCCRKPKAARTCIHADAKLAVREAIAAWPMATSRSSPSPPRPRRRCFSPAPIAGASARLEGLTWGAEDLSAELGAEANRDPEGRFLDPYRLARALCLAGAAAAQVQAIDTVYSRLSKRSRRCAAKPRKRAATASPARWRSIRHRSPSSTKCSRRLRRPSPRRAPSWPPSMAIPAKGTVGIDGVMYDRPHLERARRLLARAAAAGSG